MNDNEVANAYIDGLMEELDAAGLSVIQPRPLGFGITIKEVMSKEGCSRDVAKRILDQAVNKKLLEGHSMRTDTNGRGMVFCRPNEWPPK